MIGNLASPGESMVLHPTTGVAPNSFPALRRTTSPDSTAASAAWLHGEFPSLSTCSSICCSPRLEVITLILG